MAPTGGPADTTPALVESITPPSGTRNLLEPHFTVEFDDYIDRGIRNDITVAPLTRLNSSYSGDAISIWFDEPPLPNTTYAITIGTNWKDLRGNSAPDATTIVFSTGPDLDSGRITGTVSATTKNFQNVTVLAYPHADTLSADFNPRKTIAPYQVPVGTQGTFTIGGLKDGVYRLVAVRDANRNQLPDHDEEYGIAQADVEVVKGASASNNLLITPPTDTTLSQTQSDTTKSDTTTADSTQADSLKSSERTIYPGSISGSFVSNVTGYNSYVARFIGQSGAVAAYVHVTPSAPWAVDSIAPGTYAIDVFVDTDGNGVYSNGTLFPFTFAEPRFKVSTTAVVRERWTTEDVRIVINP